MKAAILLCFLIVEPIAQANGKKGKSTPEEHYQDDSSGFKPEGQFQDPGNMPEWDFSHHGGTGSCGGGCGCGPSAPDQGPYLFDPYTGEPLTDDEGNNFMEQEQERLTKDQAGDEYGKERTKEPVKEREKKESEDRQSDELVEETETEEEKPKKDVEMQVLFTPEDCEKKADYLDVLQFKYSGKVQNQDEIIDSTEKSNNGHPVTMTIPKKGDMAPLEKGLLGMCAGEKKRLIIPPHLAYGDEGVPGVVPGGATVEYDVELVSLLESPLKEDNFKLMDKDDNGAVTSDEMTMFLIDIPVENPKFISAVYMMAADKNKDNVLHKHELTNIQHDEL